jgi:hypothetical protein
MQRTAAILKKAPVSHFVSQRVLKSVFEIGKQAGLVNKFRRLKMSQLPSEIFFGQFGDPVSKANGKSLADD